MIRPVPSFLEVRQQAENFSEPKPTAKNPTLATATAIAMNGSLNKSLSGWTVVWPRNFSLPRKKRVMRKNGQTEIHTLSSPCQRNSEQRQQIRRKIQLQEKLFRKKLFNHKKGRKKNIICYTFYQHSRGCTQKESEGKTARRKDKLRSARREKKTLKWAHWEKFRPETAAAAVATWWKTLKMKQQKKKKKTVENFSSGSGLSVIRNSLFQFGGNNDKSKQIVALPPPRSRRPGKGSTREQESFIFGTGTAWCSLRGRQQNRNLKITISTIQYFNIGDDVCYPGWTLGRWEHVYAKLFFSLVFLRVLSWTVWFLVLF